MTDGGMTPEVLHCTLRPGNYFPPSGPTGTAPAGVALGGAGAGVGLTVPEIVRKPPEPYVLVGVVELDQTVMGVAVGIALCAACCL